jgi:16S rRNA (cytosine967-C5)-methyltransferase
MPPRTNAQSLSKKKSQSTPSTPSLKKLPESSLAHTLWSAAQGAFAVSEQGQAADDWLGTLGAKQKPAVQHYLYISLRWWWRAGGILKFCISTPPPVELQMLMRVVLANLIELDHAFNSAQLSESQHSAEIALLVNQAIDTIKYVETGRFGFFAGVANAVFRRFLREKQTLETAVLQQPDAQKDTLSAKVFAFNFPAWWIDQVQADYPKEWQAILKASRARAPMTLRVNTRQLSVSDYLTALKTANLEAFAIGEQAIVLTQPVAVSKLPLFEQGAVFVQDSGAQLAADWINPSAGERVLDVCAAPGGKTTHLLEKVDCHVVAVDIDPGRLDRLQENIERLGLTDRSIQIRVADMSQPDYLTELRIAPKSFDHVMCDVPCSGSGVVRRHPDIALLRRPNDLTSLPALSQAILHNAWQALKPGGRFLMITCSIFKQENIQVLERFLKTHSDTQLVRYQQLLPNAPESNLRIYNDALSSESTKNLDHRVQFADGFFFALIEKQEKTQRTKPKRF